MHPDRPEDMIDLEIYIRILRKVWWKAALLSAAVGIVALVVTMRMPNQYTAMAIVAPAGEESRQPRLLGALSSFGIELGGASRVEDLELLFRSRDLAVRVFRNHDFWKFVGKTPPDPALPGEAPGFLDRLLRKRPGKWPPGDWDAIRESKNRLVLTVSKKAETVTISFESPDAAGAAEIVRTFLDEGKNRLQEEAIVKTTRNKKFIEEQIARTPDPLTRDRLYSMLTQELEKEMLARNREQFGFRIIDSVRVPDRKSSPARGRIIGMSAAFSFLLFLVVFMAIQKSRTGGPE